LSGIGGTENSGNSALGDVGQRRRDSAKENGCGSADFDGDALEVIAGARFDGS